MNRTTRAAAGLALAAALLPAAAGAAAGPAAATTGEAVYATFSGIFRKNDAGDYVTTSCYEFTTRVPSTVFPCDVAFRFTTSLATICDPPAVPQGIAAGTADYYSGSLGQGINGNGLTSGGVDSTARHVHGAIVDFVPGGPTFFDIDIDLSQVCDPTVEGYPKYPVFTGVVTYV